MSTTPAPCGDNTPIPHGTEDQSGLPADHPSPHRQRHQPQEVQEAQYRAVIARAGVLELFEALVCDHPGTQSRLSLEAVHVAMLGAAANHKSYKRSDITAAVRDLTEECARAVGIAHREDKPISYGTTARLLARFEDAMEDPVAHPYYGEHRWLDEHGMYALAYWWSDQMIQASIPVNWQERITAIAVDGTCKEQWSVPCEFSTNDQLYLEHAQRRADELGLEELDLTDRENPCGTKPGELGPDGRPIRSKSPSARWGYRTQTPKDKRKHFFGHDLILGVAVHHFQYQGDPEHFQPDPDRWKTDPDRWRPGDDVPQLATALRVVPAGTDPSPPSAAVAKATRRYMPNLKDVIGDRIITNKPSFVLQMHDLDLNAVMDYTKTEVANPKLKTFGRNGNAYYIHAGGIYPAWAGPSVVEPPAVRGHEELDDPEVSDEELIQWYVERAKNYRCTVNQRLPDGGFQYRTPLAAGRIGTEHTMHTANKDATEHPADVVYPEKYFNVAPEDAVRLQDRPWPTPAWQADYGRRAIVETGNSQLKDEAGFAAEKTRIFKFVAEIIHATLIVVIHNLEEVRRYELKQQKLRGETADSRSNGKLNGSAPDPKAVAATPDAEAAVAARSAQPNGQTPRTLGTIAGELGIELPAQPDSVDTSPVATHIKGLTADTSEALRSGSTATGPTNSSNRRGRNKRRRQPQQRRQTPPNGRSPPQQ
ncbi:hypothetical protein [Candidatus Poriferisodalis sp.]|uniref:hypothetical protein n=1 Tax=Candidatus Poriferisodalis sp. TaxID=3101277 RepID=UPI003B013289